MKKATFLISILILFFGLYAASSEADLNESDSLSPALKAQQKPRIKPLPRFALIQLSGYVNVVAPDGRRMPGIKIKVYEIKLGHQLYVKEVKTNKVGFYSVRLGNAFFRKTVRLVPQYPNIREGEHFSPRRKTFEIIKAKYVHDFSYSGPLPDLVCTNSAGPRHIVRCASIRKVGGGIEIAVSVANWGGSYAGPFRVMLKGKFGNKSELYVDFPGLRANEGSMLSEDVTRRVRLLHVSEVIVQYVVIDVDNDVVENNERNNRIFGPF